MSVCVYYNEIDTYAAQWLRNLIAAGHLPSGDVDTRSIEDVRPDELAGYTQCHFFAGIGGWAYALALAGWPVDQPVWTGSCPCQPFSAAGKGAGFADERHLWPAWQHLIAQCRPAVIFGEQVASTHADPWVDLVHADMEGMGYAFGSVPFPSAGVGAPHIRDRSYWAADTLGERGASWLSEATRQHSWITGIVDDGRGEHVGTGRRPEARRVANGESGGRREERAHGNGGHAGDRAQGLAAGFEHGGSDSRLADTDSHRRGARGASATTAGHRRSARAASGNDRHEHTSAHHGGWDIADWLRCRDGKWRPVEPGTFPLAHGLSGRVGRLRAYGNAIVPQAAAEFISAYCEAVSERNDMGRDVGSSKVA